MPLNGRPFLHIPNRVDVMVVGKSFPYRDCVMSVAFTVSRRRWNWDVAKADDWKCHAGKTAQQPIEFLNAVTGPKAMCKDATETLQTESVVKETMFFGLGLQDQRNPGLIPVHVQDTTALLSSSTVPALSSRMKTYAVSVSDCSMAVISLVLPSFIFTFQ